MVGEVLDELAKAQLVDNTIVIFLSDHGMPFPGAKFNCYVNSMRSPWIIRWPGQIEGGAIDRTHMISAVDLQPTILEAVGLPPGHASDGRSFLPLLRGQPQSDRNCVFTQFYHIHGGDALPMRSVLTRQFAYVFNPWCNGERRFRRLSGATFRAMKQMARTDPAMAARIRHLQLRTVEEFFDLDADPDCLVNLLGTSRDGTSPADADHKELDNLRAKLRQWMVLVEDPALHAFDNRHQSEARERFVQDYRKRAAEEVEALKPYEKSQGYRF
jgi:N-sulfoglucosamine sulfohydrolase